MIIGLALAGILAGSLLNWAGDYLVRYAVQRPASWSQRTPRLVVSAWRLFTSVLKSGGCPKKFRAGALTEVSTAVIFALLSTQSGLSWELPFRILMACFFILVTIIDLRHCLVLNVMIYPALGVTLLLRILSADANLPEAILGAAFGFFTLAAAALVRPGELGWGDVKLATLIGLMFGFPHVLWALIIGILAGGFTAIILILTQRRDPKSHIPYAPFLSLGALVALLVLHAA